MLMSSVLRLSMVSLMPLLTELLSSQLSASPRPREVFRCRVSRTTAIPSGSRFRRRV